MKSVGDCKGGGSWGPCEDTGVSRGDWKSEQEKFLKNVGSSLEMQKALERDLLEVEMGPEDPNMVAEMRAEAERLEAEAQAKEVLVHKLPQGKICGGVKLQGFPEGVGKKKTEKREAILTIIELCNNLSQEEEEKLAMADVDVTRPERGRNGTVEVKVMLTNADALMRKIWSQLEEPCREEGMKRFMVEASTQMSPAKEKRKTALHNARNCVVEHMREEEKESKKKAEEEERKISKNVTDEEEGEVVENLILPTVGEKPPSGAPEAQKPVEKETGTMEKPVLEGDNTVMTSDLQKKKEEPNGGQPVTAEGLETVRVKAQNWTPPQQGKEGAVETAWDVKLNARS